MRVALLYSGLPRMWRACHASQMALFGNAQVDVFFHFWDVLPADEKQELLAIMRPKACVFQPLPDLRAADRVEGLRRDSISVPSRIVSQYTSWLRVAALFAPIAPHYDVAVRSRTDLDFHASIAGPLAAVSRGDLDLFGFDWTDDAKGSVQPSDVFAVGTPNAILWYLSMLIHVWRYAEDCYFNPEELIQRHLEASPTRLAYGSTQEWPFFIRRPHMDGWPVERCLAEHPGWSKWRDPEIRQSHRDHFEAQFGDRVRATVDKFIAGRLVLADAASASTAPWSRLG